ncbi:MAG: histidine phosphatase family protein [Muribaculaceae bacterium]|nr:histidine phosphatase family protein [Muribaculaceae bacterium]
MKVQHIFAGALLCWVLPLTALTPREEVEANPLKAGGIYFAYPADEIAAVAAERPKGYTPFYLSHYGRHGSRYLISDRDYSDIMERLRDARDKNALTPLGLDVLQRLDTVWIEAEGRGGELTPLGTRQHRSIARRAAAAFPEIFKGEDAEVTAASTVVMRCAHSMFAFMEGLKETNPQLDIARESSERHMNYLNYHSPESGPYSSRKGPWYQDYKRFKAQNTQPGRLMSTLFSDPAYVERWVDQDELMWQLYWLVMDMQNMETKVSFTDLFTTDELYKMWETANFNFYATNSSYPLANGEHTANARNLVRDFLDKANSYVEGNKHGASLRFGHDGNIIPLTALLKIEGAYSDAIEPGDLAKGGYANFRISPMASNVQMIFFRNNRTPEDVVVRVLLNEKPATLPIESTGPGLYAWPVLKKYMESLL